MSLNRKLGFLREGDYFSYESNIYKVLWTLDEETNCIRVKNGTSHFIEESTKVRWLKNYLTFKLM